MVRPAVRREAVEHVRGLFGISERRACSILSVDRSSMRYVHRRGADGDLRSRLREIALERRRFGYRRLGIMLAREGLVMNHKKLCGCIARRTCAYAADAAASGRWAHGHR